jgi:disulfide bond formation protein DsbB
MDSHYLYNDSSTGSRVLNLLALTGLCVVLLLAFIWQLAFNDLPCPLCLLQRVAFVLAGIGLLLNIRFGPSPLHYGIVILSALGGAAAAGRQVLSHIAPGDPGYGPPFLGLHFYTWAFILFVALIAYSGLMIMLKQRSSDPTTPYRVTRPAAAVMWLFFLLVLANMLSTLLECGFGACPDNPVNYLWLS